MQELHTQGAAVFLWRYTMSDTIHVSGKRLAPTAIVTGFRLTDDRRIIWLQEVGLVMGRDDQIFTLRATRWPDWLPIPAWGCLRDAIREAEQDEAFAQGAIA